MKLTLEPRKTTWVPFLDSKAQLTAEWRSRVEYHGYNARDPLTWKTRTRYTFSGLAGPTAIPSSQLIIMENGIPLTVAQTVVSAVKDRFQSEEVDDPFVVITDRLARLDKSEPKEKQLAKGLFERTWTETIERSLRIENRTGKVLKLALTVVDDPAEELTFVSAEPAAVRRAPPEYGFDIELAPDAEGTIKVVLAHKKSETIKAPRVESGPQAARPMPQQAQQMFVENEQADEQD
jgi:hypothetical protein